MIATDRSLCSDTLDTEVFIFRDFSLFMPNAFSPNGKGDVVNETLRLLQQGQVNKLNKLVIYNRFGQEVFSTTNINFVWDGTFQGKVLDPDVYGFYIDVECIGGAQFKNQGNITIVK